MNKKSKKLEIKSLKITGLLFWAVITFFLLGGLIVKDREFSDKENRMLNQRPEISKEQVLNGDYEKNFETYFSDQFLFRDMWIRVKAGFDRLTGNVKANGVYLCKKGYLMEDFAKPDPAVINTTKSAMSDFAQKHSDLTQYAMIVPNPVYTLEDYLPAFAPVYDQGSYLDSLKKDLENSGITFLDMRKTLSENTSEKLYYQTDHHWTTKAAYLAFKEAGKTMGYDAGQYSYKNLPVTDSFQGTLSAKSGFRVGKKEELEVYLPEKDTPASIVNYVDQQKKTASFYDTSKLDTRDGYATFFGGNHPLIKIETPVKDGKRLLVLKDSYANCFLPFLAPHYREIVVVDPRYFSGNLEELIEVEGIQEVLYLYNANTFFGDTSLHLILNQE